MTGEPTSDPSAFAAAGTFDVETFRSRVDAELRRALVLTRERLERRDPGSVFLADELLRLIDARGSLMRPICCALGFRAGGGTEGEPIVRAAAALELLHLMAVIHDDVMDEAKERRGVASAHRHLAELASDGDAGRAADPEATGRSLAILVGDLAVVCADLVLADAGFPQERVARALERYHAMRLDMAAGQALDVLDVGDPTRRALLKGGSYSIAGPLLVGAALAGASRRIELVLERFGEPLGTAFQLRDDLRDGDAASGIDRSTVASLVAEARAALVDAPFETSALEAVAATVERP